MVQYIGPRSTPAQSSVSSLWNEGADFENQLRNSGASGNGVYRFSIVAPPDDRYLPGYSIVDENGKKTYVGPRLKTLDVNYSVYGAPIPITFGVRRLISSIIWANPLTERTNRKKSGGGKGGGGKKKKETTYKYFATFASSFGTAPAAVGNREVLRIWADSQLLVDRRLGSRGTKFQNLRYTFHDGSATQGADPIIKFYNDIDGIPTPGYRDLMYVVFDDLPVEEFGDRVPNLSCEIGDNTTLASETLTSTGYNYESVNHMIDLQHQRAYFIVNLGTSNEIHKYNISDGWTLEQEITIDTGYVSGFNDRSVIYIPWEEAFFLADSSLSASQECNFVDAWSGEVISTLNITGSGGTFGVDDGDQPEMMTAGQLDNLSYNQTIIAGFTFQDTIVIYSVNPTSRALQWFYGSNISAITSINWSCVTIGAEYYGALDVYYGDDNGHIYCLQCLQAQAVLWKGGTEGAVYHDFGNSNMQISSMLYDKFDDSLIINYDNGTGEGVLKFDPVSKTTIWDTGDIDLVVKEPHAMQYSDISGGIMAYPIVGGGWAEIDLRDGSITEFTGASNASLTFTYDSKSRAGYGVNSGSSDPQRYRYDLLEDERQTLKAFLELAATMAGYTVGTDFIVDPEIDDLIDGAYITERVSFRALLDSCSTIYAFDVIESGGALKLVRKPASISSVDYDFELASTDIAMAQNDNPNAVAVMTRREMDLTLPRSIEITYVDKTRDYGYSSQNFQRTANPIGTMYSNSTLTVRVPIIMTADEAKALAYRALFLTWASRVTYQFRVPQEFIYLEPSDIGTVEVVGNATNFTYTCRIVEASYNADYSVSFKAVGYLVDEPITISADAGTYLQASTPFFSLGLFVPIDCVLLRAQDDASTFTTAAAITLYGQGYPLLSLSERWTGGYAQISLDNIEFTDFEWFFGAPVVGRMMNQLGIPENTQSADTVNTMTVRLQNEDYNSEIATCTDLQLLNGENAAVVGHPRTGWEVVQFRDVSVSGGVYTLSHLLRGRKGSEHMTGHPEFSSGTNPHYAGEYVFLLDADFMRFYAVPLTSKDTNLAYRFVSNGQDELDAITSFSTFTGESAIPLEPVNVNGVASGADMVMTCHRRDRSVPEWGDLTGDIINTEQTQVINILLTQNADGTGNSLAQATTENGSGLEEVTFTAAQLNTVYGTSTPATIYATAYQYSAFLTANGRQMTMKSITTGL